MDNNFEIELHNETIEDAESVQLPINFLSFGEIENDDVKVYIKQDGKVLVLRYRKGAWQHHHR